MTDRYHTLTVALDKDIRSDDVEVLISAIRMLRGVLDVTGYVANPDMWTAERRARMAIAKDLQDLVNKLYG